MAKKSHTLPVAKAGGPVANEISTAKSDRYAEEERRYRSQSDARALADAEAIRRDKDRMKGVKEHVKSLNKAICK